MRYAYLRVSAKNQNLARQFEAVKGYNPDKIFCDKQSGKNFDRTEYNKLKSVIRPGDELIVKELDRLGRNKEEIKSELSWFKENKIIVRILNVPTTLIDFQGQEWIFDMINNILIEVMGAVAEEERNKILERQREGLDAMPVINGKKVSVRTGRAIGNQTKEVPMFNQYFDQVNNGEMTVVECCRELGISRSKWYRLCKEAV